MTECPAPTVLLAYALEELRPAEVTAHIEICADCAGFVEDLAGEGEPVSDEVDQVATDSECPGLDALKAYRNGDLTAEDDERILAHLEECGDCLEVMLRPDVAA